MRRTILLLPTVLVALTACGGSNVPTPEPQPEVRTASVDPGVKYGDCAEALRRAAAKPDLDVDRLPSPVAMKPAPLPQPVPRSVMRRGYAEVRIQVLVDTLGKPDMSTFTVVKSTHTWLTSHVKSAVGQWTFEPALLAGCKVPRLFKWAAVAGKPPAA